MEKKKSNPRQQSEKSLTPRMRRIPMGKLRKIVKDEERTSNIKAALQGKSKKELVSLLADLDKLLIDSAHKQDVLLNRTGPPWNRVDLARKVTHEMFKTMKKAPKQH